MGMRTLDVSNLGVLVAPAEQDHHGVTLAVEVDPISEQSARSAGGESSLKATRVHSGGAAGVVRGVGRGPLARAFARTYFDTAHLLPAERLEPRAQPKTPGQGPRA